MRYFALSRKDTSILKGIAISAMLVHHLYYCPIPGVEPYSGFLLHLGELGKVCVSIFLFCSGYGLATTYANRGDCSIKGSIMFVIRRFIKFYTSYWVVLLIFIPVSVFVFGRTFEVAYAGLNIPKRIVFELFAINSFSSYNITWWFNALIVILYLLFPVIYWLMKKQKFVFLVVSLGFFWFCDSIHGNYAEIYFWQFPFVIGVLGAMMSSKSPDLVDFVTKHQVLCILLSVVFTLVLVLLRLEPIIPGWQGGRIDPFMTCGVVGVAVLVIRNVKYLSACLAFLGKHSMNIYLMHTFFNGYWNPQWLHAGTWMRGGLNFVVLLSSMFLEWMKEKSGVYSLVNKLSDRMSLKLDVL